MLRVVRGEQEETGEKQEEKEEERPDEGERGKREEEEEEEEDSEKGRGRWTGMASSCQCSAATPLAPLSSGWAVREETGCDGDKAGRDRQQRATDLHCVTYLISPLVPLCPLFSFSRAPAEREGRRYRERGENACVFVFVFV